jgi:hypothetical protein
MVIGDKCGSGLIDLQAIPQRTLCARAKVLAVGLGAFGSDHVTSCRLPGPLLVPPKWATVTSIALECMATRPIACSIS